MPEISGYPVLLTLAGRCCLVVGGGKVAVRKVRGLLEAGAAITVIAPELHPSLREWAENQQIQICQMPYQDGLLAVFRPVLVFAATNSPQVNQRIVAEAQALHLLVDCVDQPDSSDFTSMAVFRRGDITIGVSTNGSSPTLAAHLKNTLSAVVGEEYGTLARWLGELRPLIQAQIEDETQRGAFWEAVINSPILDYLRLGDEAHARLILDELWADWGVYA